MHQIHDAPPDHLIGWGGGYPLPIPTPWTPRASRSRHLWRLVLSPPSPATHCHFKHCVFIKSLTLLHTIFDKYVCTTILLFLFFVFSR